MLKFFTLIALMPLALAIIPTQCPNGGPLPLSVSVPGCPSTPCTIVNGEDFVGHINFIAPTAANTLTNVVNAYVLGIDVGYELPPDAVDACPEVGCPLFGGENISYSATVTIDAPIVGVLATIQYQMINENNDIMVCFRATANIV